MSLDREHLELKMRHNKAVRRHDIVRRELDRLRERLSQILDYYKYYKMPRALRAELEAVLDRTTIEDPDDILEEEPCD